MSETDTTASTRKHPAAEAWERFKLSHCAIFNGKAEGKYLDNRLSRAFSEGWTGAEEAVKDALRLR